MKRKQTKYPRYYRIKHNDMTYRVAKRGAVPEFITVSGLTWYPSGDYSCTKEAGLREDAKSITKKTFVKLFPIAAV